MDQSITNGRSSAWTCTRASIEITVAEAGRDSDARHVGEPGVQGGRPFRRVPSANLGLSQTQTPSFGRCKA